jgi:uncharacterized membrane protein YkvA (DUF1232 family)
MKISQLNKILKDSNQSPEKLAQYFQVSNMTLRRWMQKGGTGKIPAQYHSNIYQGILALARDGMLEKDSALVHEAFEYNQKLFEETSFMRMDLSMEDFKKEESSEEGLVDMCLRLGQKDESMKYIENNEGQIKILEKKNSGLKDKVMTLMKVLKATDMQRTQKYVAIGALFYLVFPFDLIPDHIPVIGLMDDLGVLTVAVNYYLKQGK